MTGPVRPAGPPGLEPDDRRDGQRRTGDRRRGDERRHDETPPPRALVPVGEVQDHPAEPAAPEAVSPSAFAAQVLGQTGARKGLKGGPPVLDTARSTYLGNEYAGEADRRPRPGKATRTDV